MAMVLAAIFELYYGYLLVSKTVWAYPMRGCGAASLWFQHIGERAPSDALHFIFLFLSLPFFEASHFCFKRSYTLNQRRLRLLCGEDFFLEFYNRRITTRSVVDILQSLRNIKRGLERADASKYLSDHKILISSLENAQSRVV